ncbi:hypothetical protein QWY79_10355 [Halomonas sabkhae]|uniref:hypothetical protein n=1 Tax=Halomonas sabkhae TaxID=626223 RepID=UPI0025B3C21E|nr:hypothetical protein [Halomonas sabkhae]MDN3525664.1 hypothetical protein [Halomonas sabkhae]
MTTLMNEIEQLERERARLAETDQVLARVRCDLRYHQAKAEWLALIEPWDDGARVIVSGRRLMHQFFADHYQHELEQLEGAA